MLLPVAAAQVYAVALSPASAHVAVANLAAGVASRGIKEIEVDRKLCVRGSGSCGRRAQGDLDRGYRDFNNRAAAMGVEETSPLGSAAGTIGGQNDCVLG